MRNYPKANCTQKLVSNVIISCGDFVDHMWGTHITYNLTSSKCTFVVKIASSRSFFTWDVVYVYEHFHPFGCLQHVTRRDVYPHVQSTSVKPKQWQEAHGLPVLQVSTLPIPLIPHPAVQHPALRLLWSCWTSSMTAKWCHQPSIRVTVSIMLATSGKGDKTAYTLWIKCLMTFHCTL